MPGAISAFKLAILVIAFSCVSADSNDWVNVRYTLQSKASNQPATANARNTIINGAGFTARKGPWSVTNSKGYVAPSGNTHDYLSWAPYHWPDCRWCARGQNHLANNGPDGNSTGGDDGGDDNDTGGTQDGDDGGDAFANERRDLHRMARVRRVFEGVSPAGVLDLAVDLHAEVGVPPVPTPPPSLVPSMPTTSTQTSERIAEDTAAPQAAAKTQKGSCSPSPTKSMPPSATWTTCNYVPRDGQVNPDVRNLNGPSAINDASQSILYNAIAYALRGTPSFSKNAVSFINALFLTDSTKMNPHMNFGQLVRGPGAAGQIGTFTGILDLRGVVKISNAIMVLRAAQSPDWSSTLDTDMKNWANQYIKWLESSKLGQQTASRPNNHATFYVSQLSALQLLVGDTEGAASTLQNYFGHQFLDQIAASGEQPFEAVRTRPYHYRCFNLEAMITNAKLGDELGLNLWTSKSKYGATIQTALDYTMGLKPGREDVTEILPHVAAVAAAYGDPKGKYAAFLRKIRADYQIKPFWFYDQTEALPHSPAALSKRDEDLAIAQPELFTCPPVFDSSPQVEIADGIFVTCDELKCFYVPTLCT